MEWNRQAGKKAGETPALPERLKTESEADILVEGFNKERSWRP